MKSARRAALSPTAQAVSIAAAPDPLLRIETRLGPDYAARLAADVRAGLTRAAKELPPKYFYDGRGSRLFDAICALPEYYLTRAEHALLTEVVDDILDRAHPAQLIELGSGASRKTRLLLDRLVRAQPVPAYVPIDLSESALRRSARALRAAYPRLPVHAIVTDYEYGLADLPEAAPRLVIFLGSTIGNFVPPHDTVFLRGIARAMRSGDQLLLGVDLVKSPARLHAAYNDAAGVTAEFNRNVLRVLNRELGADFDVPRFEHVAFYNPDAAQIEMHLRAQAAQRVHITALALTVALAAGETIHTESSRKFTQTTATAMLAEGGFRLDRWYVSADGDFALALAVVEATA